MDYQSQVLEGLLHICHVIELMPAVADLETLIVAHADDLDADLHLPHVRDAVYLYGDVPIAQVRPSLPVS